MKSIAFFTVLSATLVAALPAPQTAGGPKFDPSGQKNVGNAKGLQFIGGQCLSSADCNPSACCAGPSGICSGLGAQTQAGKTGCGFGDGGAGAGNSSATSPAAGGANNAGSGGAGAGAGTGAGSAGAGAGAGGASATPSKGGPKFDPAGEKNVGNAKGLQFIGGQCLSSADCNPSACCAGPSGICSGVGAQTQAGKTGCGFGDAGGGAGAGNSTTSPATPPAAGGANNAGSGSAAGAGSAGAGGAGAGAGGATATPSKGGPKFDPAGEKNVGNAKGLQFIGGQCLSSADCNPSACCAGPSGICSGLGAQTQAGKTGCGFGDAGGAGAGGSGAARRALLAGLL